MLKKKRCSSWGNESFDGKLGQKRKEYCQDGSYNEDFVKGQNLTNSKKRKWKNSHPLHSDASSSCPVQHSSLEIKNDSESKTDPEIRETELYYENILKLLKEGVNDVSRDLFASNVLQESVNKEVELSCHNYSSHCLELLLADCRDPAIMSRFMSAFSQNKKVVCLDCKASHITELLIAYAVRNINSMASENDEEKSNDAMKNIAWIEEFAGYVFENLNLLLANIYSCHIICTLIKALGCEISEDIEFMSKKSKFHKEKFRHMYNGEGESPTENTVILEKIPGAFKKILKKLSISLIKSANLMPLSIHSSAATVIQALLLILKKRLPKWCDKFIVKLAAKLYSEKNDECIPVAFLNKESSYIVETMFKAASEELKGILWHQYFKGCLKKLVNHHIGNYVIQRLFDVVQNKPLFEAMCDGMWDLFDDVLNAQHYGIFVSMSSACTRLKAQQPQFTMNMMQCLNCTESEEKKLYLVPLVLSFQKFEKYTASNDFASPEIFIYLQGSLVVQAMLEFQKPLKVVASLLNLKVEQLRFLAAHHQGCHLLNSFFGSIAVGEKNKEKMINKLKPNLVSIACDRSGSLTLSRIWVLLSINLKEIMIKELIQNKEKILSNQNGNAIVKKFHMHYFVKNHEEWKRIQLDIMDSRKRKLENLEKKP